MKLFYLFVLFLICLVNLQAQQIFSPGFAFRSHETLDILEIKNNPKDLTISLEITSYIENSGFCIDRNTFILLPSGAKLPLKSAEDMPYCPKQYSFKEFGESKVFTLRFPPIPESTICFDLIEDCDNNCIRVIGIISDPVLNKAYNSGMQLFVNGDYNAALKGFEELIEKLPSNLAITGSIYGQIIFILNENGRLEEARKRATELQQKQPPHYQDIIQDLKSRTSAAIWQ